MRPPGETGPQAVRGKNGKEMNSVAIYSFNISNVSRSTGASTCATLAYISGSKVTDERTGKSYNYAHKDRIESVSVFLPESANAEYQDPEKLMNQIEKIEKAENARTGKKIIVALPREFDKTQRDEVLKNFIEKEITDRDFGCVVAVHNDLENHNPHAHILIPNRIFKDGEFASTKRKSQYALDENGNKIPVIDPETGKQKIGERGRKIWLREFKDKNALDDKNTLSQMRESWEEVCNKELSEENKIDHRSYKERGIEKEGTVHEGYAARKREKLGLISERCEVNREILRVRDEYETIEKEIEKSKEVEREIETACKELEKELEKELKKEREQAAILAQQEMLARQAAAKAAAKEKEKQEKLNEQFRELFARIDISENAEITNTSRTIAAGENGAETGERRTTESNIEDIIREARDSINASEVARRESENDRRKSAAQSRESEATRRESENDRGKSAAQSRELEEELKKEREKQEDAAAAKAAAEEKEKQEKLNEQFRELFARIDISGNAEITNTSRTVAARKSGVETGERRTTESNLEDIIREARDSINASETARRESENDRREQAEENGIATANNEQCRREEEQRKAAERAKEEERAARTERANTKSRKERSKGQSR